MFLHHCQFLSNTGSPKPIRCRAQIAEGKAQGPPETGVDNSDINQYSTNCLAELCVIALDREDHLIFIPCIRMSQFRHGVSASCDQFLAA